MTAIENFRQGRRDRANSRKRAFRDEDGSSLCFANLAPGLRDEPSPPLCLNPPCGADATAVVGFDQHPACTVVSVALCRSRRLSAGLTRSAVSKSGPSKPPNRWRPNPEQ